VKAGIPVAQSTLRQVNTMLDDGGTGTLGIAPMINTDPGTTSRAAASVMAGSHGRALYGALYALTAQTMKSEEGQRPNPEHIQDQMRAVFGNGTEDDIKNGIALLTKQIDAQSTAIEAGAAPAVGAGFHGRMQSAGVEAPPGFLPGVANTPAGR
jgi:hypothetical protein